jgi:hypothetical protein
MKIKLIYDSGPITVELSDDELAALAARKERDADLFVAAASEQARQKRKLVSVEVV